MNLKLSGLAALFVLSAHCSQSPTTSTGNTNGTTGSTSSGSNSTSGVGGGTGSGTGSGSVVPGSGATVGGSGDTSVGSGSVAGSGDTSASGSGGSGNCTLGVQGINYSGCTACGLCWQQHCCQQSNNCLNDTTCNGYLACQSNCYNGQLPDGGTFDIDAAPAPDGATLSDDCANGCLPPDAGPLWNMMQDCISPTCDTPCLCP
jgi:hypothetical protein